MFRSAYITFTKLLQVYDYPFDPNDNQLEGIRNSFKPVFSKQYNPKVRLFQSDPFYFETADGDHYVSEADYFSYNGEMPFIKNIGAVKLWIPSRNRNQVQVRREDYFRNRIKSSALHGKFPGIPSWDTPVRGYGKYMDSASDQRFSYIGYSLSKPLYIAAHYKGECVATGRIFVNIYSSGFVSVNIALSLPQGKRYKSVEDVLPVNTHINPWDEYSKMPLEWKSKIENGTLGQITRKMIALLSDSIFTKGAFVKETQWHKSIKLHTDESVDTVTRHFKLKAPVKIDRLRGYILENRDWREKYGYIKKPKNQINDWWEDADLPKEQHTGNYYLFDKGIDIVNFSGEVNNANILHRFWNDHRILEKAMIQKCILGEYAKYFEEKVTQLRKWRLDTIETQLIEGQLFKMNVFVPAIYDHIVYIKSDTKGMHVFDRKLFSEYSRITGLDKMYADIKKRQPVWEQECLAYEAMGIKIISAIKKLVDFFRI